MKTLCEPVWDIAIFRNQDLQNDLEQSLDTPVRLVVHVVASQQKR